MIFVKQFVRLNGSQNSSSLSYPKLLVFASTLKSPIIKRFSYLSNAKQIKDIVNSSKNVEILLDSGSL